MKHESNWYKLEPNWHATFSRILACGAISMNNCKCHANDNLHLLDSENIVVGNNLKHKLSNQL